MKTKQDLSGTALLAALVLFLAVPPGAQSAALTNDNFAQAIVLQDYAGTYNTAMAAATVEAGEPSHLDGRPCKSVWWQWQAPVRGTAIITNIGGTASNVTLAVYAGASLDTLTLLAKGAGSVRFNTTGGLIYQIAAAVPAEETGDVTVSFSLTPRSVYSPVPGNLLCEGSFEGTDLINLTCWGEEGSIGGSVNSSGGADPPPGPSVRTTWPRLSGLPTTITISDFTNFPTLLFKLTNQSDAVSQFIWAQIIPSLQGLIINPDYLLTSKKMHVSRVLGDIIRTNSCIYEPTRFAGVLLSVETTDLLAQNPPAGSGTLIYLNRLLMQDAYPGEILKAKTTKLWQDFPTMPGQTYEICFAVAHDSMSSGSGDVLRLKWNEQEIAVPTSPASGWQWRSLTGVATSETTRLTFENMAIGMSLSLDGVSVVWLNEPPSIETQLASISTILGGTASFVVGVNGAWPLAYQWFFNDAPLAGKTGSVLLFDSVTPAHVGDYFVVVTNAFGAVTSAAASLAVEAPSSPTIVLQPYGDRVTVGGYFALCVAALGPPPLNYQWCFNGAEVPAATNRQLVFEAIQFTNAGTYTVKVWNDTETVWSLPATLTVESSLDGGGLVQLANRFIFGPATNSAPVFDIDGVTKLEGADYVAQLYAGATLAALRAVGAPTPFLTGTIGAGFFQSQTIVLPTVPPYSNAVVQVRVWQRSKGASYEEARALGGKFGHSEILQVVAAAPPPQPGSGLPGLQSFNLQAGLPEFNVGRISLSGHTSDGRLQWSLQGAAGCRYVIEKSSPTLIWRPLMVITNATGTVDFADPAPPNATVFYRARILD